MAGKARDNPPRNEPDSRLYEFAESTFNSLSASNVNSTQENKSPGNRYLKLRGGLMEGITGHYQRSLTIASGVLEVWKDSTGDIIPRPMLSVVAESGITDTIDLIDMNDQEVQGGRITIFGFNTSGVEIIFTHVATPSGTGKSIYCPDNRDFTLKEDEMVDLMYNTNTSSWYIIQQSIFSSVDVRTYENNTPVLEYYRDDSSPGSNGVIADTSYYGNDSAANKTEYARIRAISETVTSGSEDGELRFAVMENATLTDALFLQGSNKSLEVKGGWNIKISTSTGTKIGTASTEKIGFWGVTPVVQRSAYTVTNHVTDRAYDANATTVAELADVIGTLLVDLKSIGIIA